MLTHYAQEIRSRTLDMQKCVDHVKKRADWGARYLQKNSESIGESSQHQRAITQEFINFPLILNTKNGQTAMSAFANPFTSGVKPNLSSTSGVNPFTTNAANNNTMGPSAFGQPSFGATKTMAGSGSSTSAFGMPQFGANNSNIGNTTSGVFGSTNSATKPSAFGAPAFGSTVPANTNMPAASSAFGAPSFGPSAFGSTAAAGNVFGKAPGSMGSAFGQTGFGLNGTTASTPNAANSNSNSAFGAVQNTPLTASSPFGTLQQNTTQNTSSVFGKPAFGATGNTQSPFGAVQNTNETIGAGANPFGSFGTDSNNKSPFGNLQGGGVSGSSPFNLSNSKTNANNNMNSSLFGTTNNQGSVGQSPFGSAVTSTFGSALNTNTIDAKADANSQSPFGNRGFSFGITTQTDANKAPQSSSPFGQTASNTNTNTNTNLQNNSGTTTFGFGQQPMNTANNNTNNTRFVQGVPSEKDSIVELTDLAEETVKIFKANKFELGLVPDIPPPPALVV